MCLLNRKTANRCSGELFILDLSNAFVNTTAFNFKVVRVGCPGNTQVSGAHRANEKEANRARVTDREGMEN